MMARPSVKISVALDRNEVRVSSGCTMGQTQVLNTTSSTSVSCEHRSRQASSFVEVQRKHKCDESVAVLSYLDSLLFLPFPLTHLQQGCLLRD